MFKVRKLPAIAFSRYPSPSRTLSQSVLNNTGIEAPFQSLLAQSKILEAIVNTLFFSTTFLNSTHTPCGLFLYSYTLPLSTQPPAIFFFVLQGAFIHVPCIFEQQCVIAIICILSGLSAESLNAVWTRLPKPCHDLSTPGL